LNRELEPLQIPIFQGLFDFLWFRGFKFNNLFFLYYFLGKTLQFCVVDFLFYLEIKNNLNYLNRYPENP